MSVFKLLNEYGNPENEMEN